VVDSIAVTAGTAVDEACGFIDPATAATEAAARTVLNVGCGYPLRRLRSSIPGPEWREVRLDIGFAKVWRGKSFDFWATC
jgi:hypothetical protein